MSNDEVNTNTRKKIKKQFARYVKNQVLAEQKNPVSVSDQVARELFAEFLNKRCTPTKVNREYEQTVPTVGVNTGIFQGAVGPDFKPKYRDPMVSKILLRRGISSEQPVGDQIRFKMKDKAKMVGGVLKLAASSGEPASVVIASEKDGGWGRHAGVLTATKGTGEDINWTYVDIYQLMDYLTTYHADVAFKYLREVQHSK